MNTWGNTALDCSWLYGLVLIKTQTECSQEITRARFLLFLTRTFQCLRGWVRKLEFFTSASFKGHLISFYTLLRVPLAAAAWSFSLPPLAHRVITHCWLQLNFYSSSLFSLSIIHKGQLVQEHHPHHVWPQFFLTDAYYQNNTCVLWLKHTSGWWYLNSQSFYQ